MSQNGIICPMLLAQVCKKLILRGPVGDIAYFVTFSLTLAETSQRMLCGLTEGRCRKGFIGWTRMSLL